MPRKLVLFGNGLGRALSNEHFQLQNAMTAVWQDEDCLSNVERQLIATSIEGVEAAEGPSNEEQLLGTQLALIAIRLLRTATNDDALQHWITPAAQAFPAALGRYTFQVAKHFHNYPENLTAQNKWQTFVSHLVRFIFDSKSHVATLNYDTLLYSPFNEVQEIKGRQIKLCNGFNGTLLDGYTNGLGFSAQNMERRYNPRDKAYYMHLHGSPLFVDDGNGRTSKLTRAELVAEEGNRRSHVVLTSGTMKPSVIAASKVLRMYWDHLPIAIEEADEIVIFGYSGADDHLNKVIKTERGDKPVRIIERPHDEDRNAYWVSKLGSNITIHEFDNVLEFTDW